MRNLFLKVAALSATFLFVQVSFAQTKPFASKVETPSTKDEFKDEAPTKKEVPAPELEANQSPARSTSTPASRKVQQHSIGVGLGQTFLLGDLSNYGENKITLDLLYSYAASYSFDVVVNAHMSEHEDKNERTKLMSLNTSIKSRLFEFDNFSPYVLGGLGFYAPRVKRNLDGESKWSEQKLAFGFNVGGGVDLRLNEEWTVGTLAQLHWPFNTRQDDQPDVKGYYFKLLLTLAYSF
jgi:opacity protein-like surface antigen